MDRAQLLLVALPLFLFVSDVVNLFTPPPSKPPSSTPSHRRHDHHVLRPSSPVADHSPDLLSPLVIVVVVIIIIIIILPFSVPSIYLFNISLLLFPVRLQKQGIGYGTTIELGFCSSCSYRGNAMTLKKMLETYFPGVNVVLSNHPPPLPKRLLSKVVPIVQAGVIGIVMAGDRIFPMLGFVAPPAWYFQLRANRFGSMATTWLLGNMFQSFLQSSGAFEVYCNGERVFSKLREHRFPGELELKDLISQRISSTNLGDDLGKYWSS